MDCGDADVVEAGQVLAADNSDSRKRPRVSRDTARKLDERDQVPQYLPKVKSCVECRQQKVPWNFFEATLIEEWHFYYQQEDKSSLTLAQRCSLWYLRIQPNIASIFCM